MVKKTIALILVLFCFGFMAHPVSAVPGDQELEENNPDKFSIWGQEDCDKEIITWTLGLDLDTHKVMLEHNTGAEPIDLDTYNFDYMVDGLIINEITQGLEIDPDSLVFGLPVYIATESGHMSYYYLDNDITSQFQRVYQTPQDSYLEFVERVKSIQQSYGIYEYAGLQYLFVNVDTNNDMYYYSYDTNRIIALLELHYGLTMDDNQDQIEATLDSQPTGSRAYGFHITYETNVIEPQSYFDNYASIEYSATSTTFSGYSDYCYQEIGCGTLDITNYTDDEEMLEGISFRLLKLEMGSYMPYIINGDPVILTTDQDGHARIDNLPDGWYQLVQINSPIGYTAPFFNPTNNYKIACPDQSHIEIKVFNYKYTSWSSNVQWDDFDNRLGLRPDNIDITIFGNGVEMDLDVTWVYDGDVWVWLVKKAPIYDDQGNEIIYDIEPSLIPNYQVELDDFIIKYKLAESGTVSYEIQWDDVGNTDKRPDTLPIALLVDGANSDVEPSVTKTNDRWTLSFENVRFISDGKLLEHTLQPLKAEGYSFVMDGHTIYATYKKVDNNDSVTPSKPIELPTSGIQSYGLSLVCIGLGLMLIGVKKKES